jgi:outer membrane protein OmpA-like peptidoglycan-associated protein
MREDNSSNSQRIENLEKKTREIDSQIDTLKTQQADETQARKADAKRLDDKIDAQAKKGKKGKNRGGAGSGDDNGGDDGGNVKMTAADKAKVERPIDHFAINKHDMSPERMDAVNDKIKILKAYPNSKIIIVGHSCNSGAFDVNFKLGMLRAEMVYQYLVKNGIDESRIDGVFSKADEEPVAPNTTEKNRLKNRRVVIKVVE